MTETQQDLMAFEKLTKMKESFFKEIGKVIIGQENILEHLLIALLSQGHTLLAVSYTHLTLPTICSV